MTTPYSDTYLEPFIEATYSRASWFAYHMIAHRPASEITAQDITQTAYERLLTKLNHDPSMPKRLGIEGMTAYLLSIIRYLGYELARDAQHFKEIDAMRAFEEGGQEIEDPAAIADVETFVLANDATSDLLRRIRTLPKQQRNIIALRLEGCSHEEIAARLLISDGAMRTALHRARRSLHIWIKEDDQPKSVPYREEVNTSGSEERAILSSIERLPDPYRMVVALHMVKRMSYRDIAQLLNRPGGTVKAQYNRGKQLLLNLRQDDTEKKQAEAKAAAELQAKLAYKDHLPICWRQAVELYYLQDIGVKEITKRLGKPESTIRRWIRCAMEYLQNCEASTCPERSTEISRRKHSLPETHYQYIRHVPSIHRPAIRFYYGKGSLGIAEVAKELELPQSTVKRLYSGRESLSIAEIAKGLGLSESAVKMHLTRGREYLEDIYARYVGKKAV